MLCWRVVLQTGLGNSGCSRGRGLRGDSAPSQGVQSVLVECQLPTDDVRIYWEGFKVGGRHKVQRTAAKPWILMLHGTNAILQQAERDMCTSPQKAERDGGIAHIHTHSEDKQSHNRIHIHTYKFIHINIHVCKCGDVHTHG